MTEGKWQRWADPATLLVYARERTSRRKLRLFACACCRRVQEATSHQHGVDALDVAERLADELATNEERRLATERLMGVQPFVAPLLSVLFSNPYTAAYDTTKRASSSIARTIAPMRVGGPGAGVNPEWDEAVKREGTVQAALLRDVVGNPFRPVTLHPAWLTTTAIALARSMYDSRDFSPMPILADALQDVGCEDEAVLSHCRGDGPHVRGCWVLDLILGKA